MKQKATEVAKFVLTFLFRIVVGWYMLKLAGYELNPYQVSCLMLAGWILFYNIGGTTVNNNLIYKGNDNEGS